MKQLRIKWDPSCVQLPYQFLQRVELSVCLWRQLSCTVEAGSHKSSCSVQIAAAAQGSHEDLARSAWLRYCCYLLNCNPYNEVLNTLGMNAQCIEPGRLCLVSSAPYTLLVMASLGNLFLSDFLQADVVCLLRICEG